MTTGSLQDTSSHLGLWHTGPSHALIRTRSCVVTVLTGD